MQELETPKRQVQLTVAYLEKLTCVLRDLETNVSGQFSSIINYAAAGRSAEPISTAPTESTVHRLLHRRMTAKQRMRWSPSGALHARGSDSRHEWNIRTRPHRSRSDRRAARNVVRYSTPNFETVSFLRLHKAVSRPAGMASRRKSRSLTLPPVACPKRTISPRREVRRANGATRPAGQSLDEGPVGARVITKAPACDTQSDDRGNAWIGKSCRRRTCQLCLEVELSPLEGQDRVPHASALITQCPWPSSTLSMEMPGPSASPGLFPMPRA